MSRKERNITIAIVALLAAVILALTAQLANGSPFVSPLDYKVYAPLVICDDCATPRWTPSPIPSPTPTYTRPTPAPETTL